MMKIRFDYPSGIHMTLEGAFLAAGAIGPEYVPAIEVHEPITFGEERIEPGGALVLDPRCLCVEIETGNVLYNGREHYDRLHPRFRRWFDENPGWPEPTAAIRAIIGWDAMFPDCRHWGADKAVSYISSAHSASGGTAGWSEIA